MKTIKKIFNHKFVKIGLILMAVLVKCTDSSTIYKTIKNATRLVSMKNDVCDFTNHTGVLNAYTGLICKYFEYKLDERKEPENMEIIYKGLECITNAIEIDMKEKEDMSKVIETLRIEAMKDRSRLQIEGFTKLNLLECTRKHISINMK